MIPKGIYNEVDQRYNLFELDDDLIKEQARSVACLVDETSLDKVQKEGWKGWKLAKNVETLSQKITNFGEKEAFRNEPVIGSGTASLIGKRILLTAAHCVCTASGMLDPKKIAKTRAVFGFQMLSKDICQSEFHKSDVYRIENVIAYHLEKSADGVWADWAVLKLSKEVIGRDPLNITICDHIPKNKRVYMLGHPTGLPMKVTKNGEIKKNHENRDYFEASLDAFAGNSGSPVFIEKGKNVVGMLIQGNRDYITDRDYKGTGEEKITVSQVSEREIEANGYEQCQKVTSLVFLKSILSSIDIAPPAGKFDRFVAGLSLEATCPCNPVSEIIISRGFGSFNLSKECATAICTSCQTKIHPDYVNTMVLSSCQYQIDGLNIKNQQINSGLFTLLKEEDKMVRFDVRDWYYLELKIEEIKSNKPPVLPKNKSIEPPKEENCVLS